MEGAQLATLLIKFSGTGLPFMLQTRGYIMFVELTRSNLSSNFTGVFASIKVSFHNILVNELVKRADNFVCLISKHSYKLSGIFSI